MSVCIGNSRTTTDARLVYIERERHQTAPTVTESLGAPLHLRTLPAHTCSMATAATVWAVQKWDISIPEYASTAVGKTENLYKVASGTTLPPLHPPAALWRKEAADKLQ